MTVWLVLGPVWGAAVLAALVYYFVPDWLARRRGRRYHPSVALPPPITILATTMRQACLVAKAYGMMPGRWRYASGVEQLHGLGPGARIIIAEPHLDPSSRYLDALRYAYHLSDRGAQLSEYRT